jgi:hypothetical protein
MVDTVACITAVRDIRNGRGILGTERWNIYTCMHVAAENLVVSSLLRCNSSSVSFRSVLGRRVGGWERVDKIDELILGWEWDIP